jgi:hypothetical protein
MAAQLSINVSWNNVDVIRCMAPSAEVNVPRGLRGLKKKVLSVRSLGLMASNACVPFPSTAGFAPRRQVATSVYCLLGVSSWRRPKFPPNYRQATFGTTRLIHSSNVDPAV